NPKPWESQQIGFLRKYSNYLTPRRGFTTDTLTLGVAYTINFVLNLIVLVLIFSAVLTLPIIAVKIYSWIESIGSANSYYMVVAAVALLMAALICAFTATKGSTAEKNKLNCVIGFVVFFLLTCISLSIALWQTPKPLLAEEWYMWSFYTGLLFGLALLFGRTLTGSIKDLTTADSGTRWRHSQSLIWELIAALIAGFVTGPLLYAAASFLGKWSSDAVSGHWQVAVWGLPIVVFIFAAATIAYSGIAGRDQDEYLREWTFRLWALLAKYTCAIGILLFIVVYGPLLLMKAETYISTYLSTYLTIGWLIATIGGVLAGKSEWLQAKNHRRTIKLAITVAPYLFIAGLVMFLSWGLHAVWTAFLVWLKSYGIENLQMVPDGPAQVVYWKQLNQLLDFWFIPLAGFIVFFLSALVLSYRLGVNEFSLHALYGNRLVRAYLGASNPDSISNPGNSKRDRITFFNPSDNNVRLNFLSSFQDRFVIYPGPFTIINTTLNLMQSQNLAWQKRKGASFIFSALYSGYDSDASDHEASNGLKNVANPAYVRSNKYSSQSGVSLGKAMTISGAAASPNMGYCTSTPLAFLMTVFNVRLGWWLANSIKQDRKLLKRKGPKIGISYLLLELLAKAGEKSSYVYLSDGGHFENIGIYELVKRRCRYIVACDASQDRQMKFDDLGNAIEKCRTDFGIDILIDVNQIRRQNDNGYCSWHCAVGKIRYGNVDRNAPDGTLIYIKASLTGDEPLDLARYASQYPDFPHQSTADQWFDETQFESYRRLGDHIVHTVFGNAVNNTDVRNADPDGKAAYDQMPRTDIERLFHELQEQWYPPSEAVSQLFNRHASGLEQIISQLKNNEKLRFLDLQIYPVFSKFDQELSRLKKDSRYLPESFEELRAGFYMCKQMLIFMEGVYHDLNLDREFSHPDNRGWINLFQRWAWSRMFRFTWSVTASTFGARFQKFCEQRMNFRRDEIQIGLIENGLLTGCEVTLDTIDKYSSQAAAQGVSTKSPDPVNAESSGDSDTVLVDFWKVAPKKFGFNYFERRMIEDLLRTNLKPCKIFPIFIKTDDNPLKDDAHFYFNVGFVMMDLEQKQIYYFRIQNHLRQMGLARRSLRALLSHALFQQNPVCVEFIKPSPKAPEIPSTVDRLNFEHLFHSVRNEIH
ncbi:MAG: hypothetical protein KJO34_11525, partial [Deltaproteobacteria bacterium]|nr:hypothetical protein [Deltaproteobacteria bacterium]